MNETNPTEKIRKKPPRRHWQAREPFFDLKFSHWVEIILTVALVFVGISQLFVYSNQALIMRGQLSVMEAGTATQRAELAARMAWEATRVPENEGWTLTIKWTNSGKTDAM